MPILLRNRCIWVQADADWPALLLPSLRQGLEAHHGRRRAGHDRPVSGGSPRRWRRPVTVIPADRSAQVPYSSHPGFGTFQTAPQYSHQDRAPRRCGTVTRGLVCPHTSQRGGLDEDASSSTPHPVAGSLSALSFRMNTQPTPSRSARQAVPDLAGAGD